MTSALITNDDGISSPGLIALARAALAAGFDVTVAAPATQHSGVGASIAGVGDDGQVPFELRSIAELPGVSCYAVEAAPALIVLLAAHGTFGTPPDLVLSGINLGANAGRAILHSGTVGAALTGAMNGARALAVSLDVGHTPAGQPPAEAHWATAAALSQYVFSTLLALPHGTTLNLNVPNVAAAPDALPTLHEATLSEFGIVQTTTTDPGSASLRLVAADPGSSTDPTSDTALLRAGYATLTSLAPITALPLTLPTPS